MPQLIQTFEDLDAMSIRQKLGELLDNVGQKHSRYVVTRKGTPKALLVPIEDKIAIEKSVSAKEQDKTYATLQKLNGMITDQVSDTSEKINEIVYGQSYDQAQHLAHQGNNE